MVEVKRLLLCFTCSVRFLADNQPVDWDCVRHSHSFRLSIPVLGVQANPNCTLGRTNLTVVSANPSPGLFIDMQTPAPCSGLVTEWNVCYFNPRYFNDEDTLRDGLEIGLQVWRFSTPDNADLVDQYVATIDIPPVTEFFQCAIVPLPPRDYMSVEGGDVMGAEVAFGAVLPVVGNFLSQTSDNQERPELLSYMDGGVGGEVSRGQAKPLANNVLHVTAEITGCDDGGVRLADGFSPSEGHVEICQNGVWSVVCGARWNNTDARVVCRQLGFPVEGSSDLPGTTLGEGRASRSFVTANCTGGEASLVNCMLTAASSCDADNIAGVTCAYNSDSTAVYFNGQLYQNNSLINAMKIEDDRTIPSARDSLVCLTNRFPCCSGSDDGSWYNPDGFRLSTMVMGDFYQQYFPRQSVILYRSSSASSSSDGLFHCQISDRESVTQYMYIGIYSSGNGIPIVSSVMYENSSQTLVCTSTGGPATSVTWSRDNTPLVVDGTTYEHSQIITDTNTATYQNRLRIVQGSSDGVYTCTVSNSKGRNSAQLILGAEVEMTTTAEADGPSQVDTHQLRMLAVAFGLLFGITLLALIAVTAIFVIYVIWNNRKKKGSLDIPPTESMVRSTDSVGEIMVNNALYGLSIDDSLVHNATNTSYSDTNKYEDVDEVGVRENVEYEYVMERTDTLVEESVPKSAGTSTPLTPQDGYSQLQQNRDDSALHPKAKEDLGEHSVQYCAPPIHNVSNISYSLLEHK